MITADNKDSWFSGELFTQRRTALPFAVLGVVVSACCHSNPPRVVSFDVQPPQSCPDKDVTITWEVVGAAKLAIVPGKKDPTPDEITALEEDVGPKGSRPYHVTQTTGFAIRAVDANQAKDQSHGTKWVDVPVATEEKRASTDCDQASSKCTGKFLLQPPHGSMRVVRISAPKVTQGGHSAPGTICITHDTLNGTCVSPEQPTLDTSVSADGEWTVETTIPSGGSLSPPPALTVTVQFSCP